MAADIDPRSLSLDDLRLERNRLQHEDDAVSYVRRIAQARIDIVAAELNRSDDSSSEDLSGDLQRVLSQHLTAPSAATRAPRVDDDHLANDARAILLDQLCAEHGFSRLSSGESLSQSELASLTEVLTTFERNISADRRERFERIDALGAELVRRFRSGEVQVDQFLDADS
jgi:hypothetical protein